MSEKIKWSEPMSGWSGVSMVAAGLANGMQAQVMLSDWWHDVNSSDGLFPGYPYRVGEIVEPRSFWINSYGAGGFSVHESREDADSMVGLGRVECMLVQEVF